MTTLDDFRVRLNECPDDWQCLLALSDFLQDTDPDDLRIEGYRCMGQLRLYPRWFKGSQNWGWLSWSWLPNVRGSDHAKLCDEWLREIGLNRHVHLSVDNGVWYTPENSGGPGNGYVGAFVLFKAAALAFSKLPPTVRADLLSRAPGESEFAIDR